MILKLPFAVRKLWYQLVSVFKGADWMCCWYCMRKCTIKIKLLRDSFENRYCDFAKEVDCIFAFRNHSQLVNKNTQMELLDFKTNLILKTKFYALSSVPGTYNLINFWRSLPCKNFPNPRKFTQSYMYVVLKWRTHANKHSRPWYWLKAKRGRAWLIQNFLLLSVTNLTPNIEKLVKYLKSY